MIESDDWNELLDKISSQENDIKEYKKLIEQLCTLLERICLTAEIDLKGLPAYTKARSI